MNPEFTKSQLGWIAFCAICPLLVVAAGLAVAHGILWVVA